MKTIKKVREQWLSDYDLELLHEIEKVGQRTESGVINGDEVV